MVSAEVGRKREGRANESEQPVTIVQPRPPLIPLFRWYYLRHQSRAIDADILNGQLNQLQWRLSLAMAEPTLSALPGPDPAH
jgi:hypothetical protein